MKKLNTLFSSRSARILSLAALAVFAISISAEAQNGIAGGLAGAAQEIKNYLDPVQKICYAIAALIFLVGGLSIYTKMNNGDQDVKSSIMMYVGGALFLIIVGSLAPTIFG